ncbi:MAG TPA: NAD-dependent epimerase/dehydratase family protein [Flavobacteriales bacterium]|nr:NAD-dependent epimerase/dehydratase family protein [Flavobacteriales bacterium]
MILVTGGTGLIGAHLLLYLSRKGIKTKAIYRDEASIAKTQNLFKASSVSPGELMDLITWVKADVTDITSLEPAFKDVTHVYHTAAVVSFNPKDRELMKAVNVEGTANMVNLALDNGIEKFIHVSSIAALGSYDNPITEETHWNWKEAHSDYAVSKYLSEMEVWRAGQEGLPMVILNPSVVIGAHFWHKGIGMMIERINKGLKYYPPGGNGFVDVWDIVKAMTQLMGGDITNESFIISPYDIRYKQLLDSMAHFLGKKAPYKPLNKSVAYMLYLSSRFYAMINPKAEPLSKELMLETFFQFPHYSSEKLVKALDFSFIPFEASMQNLITQYKKIH